MRAGVLRRSTFNWCRSTRFSASNEARDRNSPAKAHQINLQRSSITREHQRFAATWLADWVCGRDRIARQFTEAIGWRDAPRYLVRDRDRVYGSDFIRRIRAMGIRDRPISARSPWQNGCAERLIGSIRRECLDHVVVFGERHLRNLLLSYQNYYNEYRTHLSLDKDAPLARAVTAHGRLVVGPVLGGLHHQYCRILNFRQGPPAPRDTLSRRCPVLSPLLFVNRPIAARRRTGLKKSVDHIGEQPRRGIIETVRRERLTKGNRAG
jgi:hypothetical protein